MTKLAAMTAAAGLMLMMAACGGGSDQLAAPGTAPASTSTCKGFALSLASDRGGQPTPVAAAPWFLVHGGVNVHLPPSGWRDDGRDAGGVTLRSGASTLHVTQGADQTWQVDAGTAC